MSARPSTSSPDSASGATYLSVPTKKPVRVRRSSAGRSADQIAHLRRSEGAGTVYVLGEGFPVGPLQGEVMEAVGIAVIVGAHDARMLDPRAVSRFTQETLDHRGVAPQPLAQYLERTRAALGVLGPVHFGRASLADALEQAVAGDRPTGEVLAGHGNARN